MSQTRANILMLIATLIWGTAFVSQTTGMGSIGPFTFSFSRFFFATITVLPLALYFERNNFAKILLVFIASEPPFRIAALPDLKHKAATSDVTLGLLS